MEKVEAIHISSWEEFRTQVSQFGYVGGPTYWRGQANSSWVLASSFERMILSFAGGLKTGASMRHPYDNRYTREGGRIWEAGFYQAMRDRYKMAFRHFSTGLRGANPQELDDDQWWALARHYGVTTPLLDWTEKPYIAAFFAIQGLARDMSTGGRGLRFEGKSAAVFRLLNAPDLTETALRVLQPTVHELGRMHNQRGLFTWLDSEEFFDLESFLEASGKARYLTKFILSEQVVMAAITDLRNFGIDSRMIYPDLHGAALAANEKWDMYGPL